jgi:urease subunit alpha
MFGSFGCSLTQSSITFVSKAGLALGIKDKFALKKRLSAVQNIRQVRKADMIHNDLTPAMDTDPQSYAVKADGELLTCEAATVLPMAQRYFLF